MILSVSPEPSLSVRDRVKGRQLIKIGFVMLLASFIMFVVLTVIGLYYVWFGVGSSLLILILICAMLVVVWLAVILVHVGEKQLRSGLRGIE